MLDLLAQRDKFPAAADADSEKGRQILRDVDGLFILARADQPDDCGQGIVQEVRVDLELQRANLRFLIFLLLLVVLPDRAFKLFQNLAVLVVQDRDFVFDRRAALRRGRRRVKGRDAADQPVERLDEAARHHRAQQHAKADAQRRHDQRHRKNGPEALVERRLPDLF
ncbi:hypothetical protein SDC9_193778 [bioreactor metagenome]|uniref:Uncharacterized protein n=1 Tax=bioreactor metagenome TaxID=1076179 RepID=A0A645I4F9_9ZZZZ